MQAASGGMSAFFGGDGADVVVTPSEHQLVQQVSAVVALSMAKCS